MAKSLRQSVTIPADLAREIEREARRQHKTFSKALIDYTRAGLTEQQRARRKLRSLVRKIQAAPTFEEADRLYGEELIETIFGPQEPRAQD